MKILFFCVCDYFLVVEQHVSIRIGESGREKKEAPRDATIELGISFQSSSEHLSMDSRITLISASYSAMTSSPRGKLFK